MTQWQGNHWNCGSIGMLWRQVENIPTHIDRIFYQKWPPQKNEDFFIILFFKTIFDDQLSFRTAQAINDRAVSQPSRHCSHLTECSYCVFHCNLVWRYMAAPSARPSAKCSSCVFHCNLVWRYMVAPSMSALVESKHMALFTCWIRNQYYAPA